MNQQDYKIREMQAEEKEQVKSIMKDAFPFLMRLFFSFSNHILVAEKNGVIVGGVILKMFFLPKKVKAGLVSLIFCTPRQSGQGIGQILASKGVKQLEEKGCSEIFACVEGNNTSSNKLFITSGFHQLSLFQQVKTYGFSTLLIWFHSYHLFDVGHFLLSKSTQKREKRNSKEANSWFEFIFTLICHVAIFSVTLWRQGEDDHFSTESLLTLLACFGLFFAVRCGAMFCISWFNRIQYEFRMWESGLSLSSIIALLFGGFMVSPGTLYPVEHNWKYRDHTQPLGVMALASSLSLITLVWAMGLLIHFSLIPSLFLFHFETAFSIGIGLLFLDVMLPFFPFSSFNGRRLWDWSKPTWALLSLSIIPLLIVF